MPKLLGVMSACEPKSSRLWVLSLTLIAAMLSYTKWMPARHSSDGPIWNVAGLKFSAARKPIPWSQDSVDMYTFHLEVPQGVNSVSAKLDFLLSVPGSSIDFSASGSAKLFILM